MLLLCKMYRPLSKAFVNAAHHVCFRNCLASVFDAQRPTNLPNSLCCSTIWMARALPPDGKIVTLEHDPTCARVARENLEAAGFSDRVEVLDGDALQLLAQLDKDKRGPFDFIFIDANKQPEREYFEGCMKLSRSGTVIIGDNVVRDGEVANLDTTDERVKGIHRATDMLQDNPRYEACALQTIGVKGWDGWLMVLVN